MLENEYIVNLANKFNEIINEANKAKDLYVSLGQKYAAGEELKDTIINQPAENQVQDLEDELNRINNMTFADYSEMVQGTPTEEEFEEWKNTRVETLQNLIEEERVRRAERTARTDNAALDGNQLYMDEASDEYDKTVEELKKHVEKINTQFERTAKRIQIRLDELDEDIAEIVDELSETKDHDERIRLSKELESYRTMKVSYETNLATINEIKDLPNEISNSIEDYEKVEELLATATEKLNEVNGRISRATNEIEVNVSYNKQTGKYTVECSCGNFKLSPGKEYTAEELTKENIGKLLKGFVGALANNRVALYKNGMMYMKTSFENAANNIVEVAKDMEKVAGVAVEEDKPLFNPSMEESAEPPVIETPSVESEEDLTHDNSSGLLTAEEIDDALSGMNSFEKDEEETLSPLEQPQIEEPEVDKPEEQHTTGSNDGSKPSQSEDGNKTFNEDGTFTDDVVDSILSGVKKEEENQKAKAGNGNSGEGKPEEDKEESDKNEMNKDDSKIKADPVVKKVIKSRNALRLGTSITGAIGAATALGIAGIPLLGVPVVAVAAYGFTNVLVNAAAQHKSNKIRKTLSRIADKYDLIVKVDRETKSVYFCSTNDLSTRITSEDLNNPNPDVRRVAEQLQDELDEVFENDQRGLATPEQMEEYEKKIGNITQKPPLEFCQKVTLDNLEAAYQQIGGVYSVKERKNVNLFNKNFKTLFQQDAETIATDFSRSMQPETPTEVVDVEYEDVTNLEKGQGENDKTETTENTEDKSQEVSASQQSPVVEEEPELASEQQPEPVEEVTTVEEPKEEKTEPTPASNVDVDNLDNAEDLLHAFPTEDELKRFLDGVDVNNKLKSNSSNVHNANAYEEMATELDGPEVEAQELGEEKGRTL